jgi:ankyrin repeat protein
MRNFNIIPYFYCNEYSPKGYSHNHITLEEEMVNYLTRGYTPCKVRRIRKMVFNGVDLKSENFLTTAIDYGHEKKIIKYLIDVGCDVNAHDYRGDNALTLAIRACRLDIVDLLLNDREMNINGTNHNGYSPLMVAAMNGSEKMIDKLIRYGANINQKFCNGNTALHMAVKSNHYLIVKKLLENNACVKIINDFNETPICFASNYNVIKILLLYKANPNHTDKKQNTLLHRLVKYGSVSCIKLLIDYQANPLIENYQKLNVVEYARTQEKQHIVDILVKYSLFVKAQYHSMITSILEKNRQEKLLCKDIMKFLF